MTPRKFQASVAQCKDDQESFESSEADLAAAVVGLESAISTVTAKAGMGRDLFVINFSMEYDRLDWIR